MESNNLWEYKESINRLQATPQDVEKVKQQVEYSNRLVKAHNIMKVLDLPDEQDNAIRQILLKQDDNILEELVKKPKREIQTFLIQANENQKYAIHQEKDKVQLHTISEDNKNDEKFLKLKSFLPPSILTANSELNKNFQALDDLDLTKQEKKKIQDKIIAFLKQPWQLQSITDQLWWANKNNPEYLEFKNALLGVDSGFESYFNDLEKMNSWNSLSTNEIVKWIEKESGWMMSIDLNSNTPMSKMSLIWSEYSFDEEIDKKVLDTVEAEKKEHLDDVQNSVAVLNGLYKPFDNLVSEIRKNWWKDSYKENMQWVISNISKGIFSEASDMYEKMGIKSDIQVKEVDFSELANASSESDLKQKVENIKEKFEHIKAQIQEAQAQTIKKYQVETKELLSRKSDEKKKQLEVLNFMKGSGFDLIPKELSDSIIAEIQGESLKIPGLNMNIKNIDLKNGNFGEDAMYQWGWLNIASKTNLVKFMNKLISWDINKPMSVDAVTNWTMMADPSELNGKFLEAGVVDTLGWNKYRMMENLKKSV